MLRIGIEHDMSAARAVTVGVMLALTGCASSPLPVTPPDWVAFPPLPVAVRAAAVATDGELVYVVGGSSEQGRTGVVQILDLDTRTWAYGPSLPVPTDWGVAAWAEDGLHFIGGVTDAASSTTRHFVLSSEADRWRPAPPLPAPLAGMAAVALGSRIHVFAGNAGRAPNHTAGTWVLDVDGGMWEEGPAVPGPRINWSATRLDGRVYLTGGGLPGLQTSDDLLVFDPGANSWSGARPMPLPREAHAMAAYDGRACVVGGRRAARGNFNQPMDDVACYDPASDRWFPGRRLPRPLQELTAVSLDAGILVLGGADEAGRPVHDVFLVRSPR